MQSVPDLRTVESAELSAPGSPSFVDGTTTIDTAAVDLLREFVIPAGTKGMPLGMEEMTLDQLARSGWNVLRDGLPMPLMILKERALATNLTMMVEYCVQHGVSLCPHGKTTMSPQLFRRQLDAGAWGLTAATPSHLRLYRRFGVERIFYANQLVEPAVIDWLADELERASDLDFYCLVDSVDSVSLLEGRLAARSTPRPIGVLLEAGYARGRCGVRDLETARRVAAAVDASRSLELRGVECFEGLIGDGGGTAPVVEFLGFVGEVAADLLHSSSLREAAQILVSAGGSAYFDCVVDAFVDRWEHAAPAHVVLRSGCYVTQDGGFYGRTSPLGGRRHGPAVLRDAIEIWSAILSRPEPGLAICSMGRRDAPQDMGMPVPTQSAIDGGDPVPLHGATVVALSDQHAHLAVDPTCELGPGDLVACAISHPCTAFDRWQVIPVVDDAYTICDAVVTFF